MNYMSEKANLVTKHKSKLGIVVVLPLVIVLLLPLLFGEPFQWIDLVIILFVVFFLSFMYLTMVYEIHHTTGKLILKVGFVFSKEVAVKDIVRIVETNDIASGYSFSLDRLELFYSCFDSVLVSPRDKVQFLIELKELNPNIVFKPKK